MGYEQLEAIAHGLAQVQGSLPECNYLDELHIQVKRALVKNRTMAEDLKKHIRSCSRWQKACATRPQVTSRALTRY